MLQFPLQVSIFRARHWAVLIAAQNPHYATGFGTYPRMEKAFSPRYVVGNGLKTCRALFDTSGQSPRT